MARSEEIDRDLVIRMILDGSINRNTCFYSVLDHRAEITSTLGYIQESGKMWAPVHHALCPSRIGLPLLRSTVFQKFE